MHPRAALLGLSARRLRSVNPLQSIPAIGRGICADQRAQNAGVLGPAPDRNWM